MTEMWREMGVFLAAPLALTVLMVGMHAYLGLHVLQRDVIFVDISLSQVAALGAALSLWMGGEENEFLSWILSLGLCLLVALILAAFRRSTQKISQETLIGMTYALASGALVLVMDRLPHGAEHLKSALVGNILFVTWPEVFITAGIYSFVGVIHFLFRQKFWAVTTQQVSSFFWDFLFYMLFGVVITLSTKHAGVLVVFAILVAPAALASLWTQKLRHRLALAWGVGVAGVFAAFVVSTYWDWPAGPSLVVLLTALFFLSLVFQLTATKVRARPD